jgi:hypothetical protein
VMIAPKKTRNILGINSAPDDTWLMTEKITVPKTTMPIIIALAIFSVLLFSLVDSMTISFHY